LQDPINAKIFKILLFNAGSNALYQKKIRKSQLRITYTLLYHLGLRLNEIRTLEIQDILQGIERQELKLHYSKQTDPIMLHFHPVL
jgi:integrase